MTLQTGRSRALWERSRRSLAGGVSSNVRAGAETPLFFEYARGAQLYDVDGNRYLDYVIGQGPMLLGHTPESVMGAVQEALQRGQLFAGQHELEIVLSEKLQSLIPCAEMLRYSNSGSEIVQAALRLARAWTGREKIVKFEGHYHGWFDNVLVSVQPPPDAAGPRHAAQAVAASEGQAKSALADVIVLPWNDLALLEERVQRQGDEIAAVIMEPVMCNTGCIPPVAGYLEGAREICSRHGIVLIFDEVITGFRLGLGGAQGYFGVTPDLATFGKAMASGFTLSCLAGRRDMMELIALGRVNHSGTFNSNVTAMAAACATLEELERDDGRVYGRLFDLGQSLMEGIRALAQRKGSEVLVQGPGPMFHVAFSDRPAIVDYRSYLESDRARSGKLAERLLAAGIRATERGLWYLCAAHEPSDVEFTLEALESVWD